MKTVLTIGAMAALTLTAGIAVADPQSDIKTITVGIDEIARIPFGATAQTVFIANPAIADAVMQSGTEAVLHGRMPGTTDLLVSGEGGEPIGQWRITVTGPRTGDVLVFRGPDRQTLYCDETCSPGVVTGDGREGFSSAAGQASTRDTFVRNASEPRGEDLSGIVE